MHQEGNQLHEKMKKDLAALKADHAQLKTHKEVDKALRAKLDHDLKALEDDHAQMQAMHEKRMHEKMAMMPPVPGGFIFRYYEPHENSDYKMISHPKGNSPDLSPAPGNLGEPPVPVMPVFPRYYAP